MISDMTDDEIIAITTQGARYLQAAQQDADLNLQLTHYNYAVAYFETVTRHAALARILQLTNIDADAAMAMAQRGQNAVNLEYMQRMGIPLKIPMYRRA